MLGGDSLMSVKRRNEDADWNENERRAPPGGLDEHNMTTSECKPEDFLFLNKMFYKGELGRLLWKNFFSLYYNLFFLI